MFGAVMINPENCKRVFGESIGNRNDRVDVSQGKKGNGLSP